MTDTTHTLRVHVRGIDDKALPEAEVSVRQGRKTHRAEWDEATSTFLVSDLEAGAAELRAGGRGLADERREIRIAGRNEPETVILGPDGAPAFYRGPVRVPFEPRPDLIGVQLRGAVLSALARAERRETGEPDDTASRPRLTSLAAAAFREARPGPVADLRQLADLVRRLELEVVETPEEVRRSGVLLLEVPSSTGDGQRREILAALEGSEAVERAGQVVVRTERTVSFLTDELVVALRVELPAKRVHGLARELGLEVLRRFGYGAALWHLRRPGEATYEILEVVEKLRSLDEVAWAEPNLVTSVELDAVNPADYLWPAEWDRQLVGTPDAWQILQDNGLETYGSPEVVIAFVDQGIESTGGVPDHPDFQGTVSDGTSKVFQLYDFGSLVANNDAPYGDHGMGVSGIGAARPGNASPVAGVTEGLAGAAPNCRVMGLMYPFTEVDQADMYIWAAGMNPNSPRVGFPAPLAKGADVFSTSIGFGAGAPISGLAATMLNHLTTFGRGGKGCLCFFSAGNASIDFTTYRPWAAYGRTWGMAASTLDDDGTTEIRAPYSGFGPAELCAPSHDEYVGGGALHDPPDNYGTLSCDLLGGGNLMGHPAVQTDLTAPAGAGTNVLTVASTAGISAGDRVMVGAPAPTGWETATVASVGGANTLNLSTNLLRNHAAGEPVAQGPANYRTNFGGTSSATPLAAGVAALVLSANPNLTWVEARQVLRDTAVKIDAANTDPTGQWLDENGVPSETSGLPPVFSQWYGYGRIDAAAAVQGALDFDLSRDLVVRENLGDTGTVASAGAFWNSPDIWCRTTDPAVEGAAALPAGYGVAGPHQSPIAGQQNWVYVRVKNVGTLDSLDYWVRLSITHFPGFEFTWPDSFIPSNRPGDPVPNPMVPGTYLIGEVAATGLAAGDDVILNVPWPAALIPPETVMVEGMNVSWHPCLLAEVTPHDGPAPTGDHVWDDNNLAQKNISIIHPDLGGDSRFFGGWVMGHPANRSETLILELDRSRLPRGVRLWVDFLDSSLFDKVRRVTEKGLGGEGRGEEGQQRGCEITLLDKTRLKITCGEGEASTVLTVPQGTTIHQLLGEHGGGFGKATALGGYQLGLVEGGDQAGRRVAFISAHGTARLPLPIGAGRLQPLVIGGEVGDDTPKGEYSVPLLQRNDQGDITGSAELLVVVD